MLHRLAISSVFLLLITMTTTVSATFIPPNLLLNGGFEWGEGGWNGQQKGVARAWETICGGSHPEIYSLDTIIKRSGRYSQKMTSENYNYHWLESGSHCYQPSNGGEVRHPVPTELGLQAIAQSTRPGHIQPGKTYELSAWVRIEGLEGRWEWFRLSLYWLNAQHGFIGEARQEEDPEGYGTHDWKQIKVITKAPENAAFAKVYLHHHFVTGTVWFDDIRLSVIEP